MPELKSDTNGVASVRAHTEVEPKGSTEARIAGSDVHDTPYLIGPWRAWTTVLGGALLQACVAGPITAFGVFQDFYSSTWLSHFSQSNISWIGSVQLFLAFGLGTPAGRLYDSGYGRHTLVVGGFLYTVCFFMISFTQPQQYYQVFLAQGIGLGLGYALVYIPTYSVVAHHFKSRKAAGMGVLAAGGPIGSIIFTILINQLIHHGTGFRWAIRAAGFLLAGCFIVGNALITVPKPITPTSHASASATFRAISRDLPFILTLLSGFTAQLGTFFPIFYVQVFASNHGLSKQLTFYTLAIINVSNIFGRTIPNLLADRFGVVNSFIVCVGLDGCQGAVTFLMLASGKVPGLVIFCILYGFFFGATTSLFLPTVVSISPNKENMGAVMGLGITPVGVASLIGPPISGAILGSDLVWWKGVTFASMVLISASAIQLIALQIYTMRLNRTQAGGLEHHENQQAF